MPLNLIIRLDSLRLPLSGIGYYTFYLLRELLKHPEINRIVGFSINGVRTKQDLVSLIQHHESAAPIHTPNVSTFIQKIPGMYSLLKKLIDVKEAYSLKPYRDFLYHEPSFLSLKHKGPAIVTIHDLSHIRHPETHPQTRVKFLNKHLINTLQRTHHIIADSTFTRDELLDLGLVRDPTQVSVVHLGVEPLFHSRSSDSLSTPLSNFKLRSNAYILASSTLEPRKNLPRLIQAYNNLPNALKKEYPLVLSGAEGWHHKPLLNEISKIVAPGKVILTGYLSRENLAILMSGAAAFAYPSLYEGFGLPVVEAMASNTPVLTSNNSSMKEIAGDCALLVDPLDIDDMSEKLAYLLKETEKTNTLKQKGIEHAKKFSWSHCADSTIKIYKRVFL